MEGWSGGLVAGGGGGTGGVGRFGLLLVNFHRQRTEEVTEWFSCACSHSCPQCM